MRNTTKILNRWKESNKKYDLMANIISDLPKAVLLFFFLKVWERLPSSRDKCGALSQLSHFPFQRLSRDGFVTVPANERKEWSARERRCVWKISLALSFLLVTLPCEV